MGLLHYNDINPKNSSKVYSYLLEKIEGEPIALSFLNINYELYSFPLLKW